MNIEIKINETTNEPIYIQVKNSIKEYILKNNLPAGTKLPSLTAIAEMAGVSLKTAERGVDELIKENICYRRPKFGTFVNGNAGIREMGICPVYHQHGEDAISTILHEARIMKGIREAANKKSGNVMFLSDKRYIEEMEFFLRHSGTRVPGILIFNNEVTEKVVEFAEKFPMLKIVCLNYYTYEFESTPPNVYGVFNDEFAGSYRITEYLISRGHRNIGFINLDIPDDNYRERERGYRHALEDNGIQCDEKSIVLMQKPDETKDHYHSLLGREGMKFLLERNNAISAICTVHDEIAAGAAEYLRDNPYGRNIVITGYDNMMPELTRNLNISTVSVNFVQIGRRAVDILYSEKTSIPKVNRIVPDLIIRN